MTSRRTRRLDDLMSSEGKSELKMMFRYIREPANTSSHIIMPWTTTGTLPICKPLRDASCTVLPLDLLDQLAEVAVLLNGRARAMSEKVLPGEISLALSSCASDPRQHQVPHFSLELAHC